MVQGEIFLYRSLAKKENISNFTDTQAMNEVQPNCSPSEILRVLCWHEHSQILKFGTCIVSSNWDGYMLGTSTQYCIQTQVPFTMHMYLLLCCARVVCKVYLSTALYMTKTSTMQLYNVLNQCYST